MLVPSKDAIGRAIETTEDDRAAQISGARQGETSVFTCPDCGGTLWQVDEPEVLHFRCHVGHVLTGEALLKGQTESAENALWFAVRSLVDASILSREMARLSRDRGDEAAALTLEANADASRRRSDALRQIAERPDP